MKVVRLLAACDGTALLDARVAAQSCREKASKQAGKTV